MQHAGMFRLFNSFRKNAGMFVLMYHRILPSVHEEKIFVQPGMYVSSEVFRRQIAFLKTRYHVLSLIELVQRLGAGKSVAGCCAITFDDGWRDNYAHAYPVLKEFNVPATIFLATGFIGTNRLFWPEEVGLYLQRLEVFGRDYKHPILKSLPHYRSENRVEQFNHVVMLLKDVAPQQREEFLADLRTQSPGDTPSEAMLMRWQEVKEMLDGGLVDFGAHSHNHVILDQVPFGQAEKEVMQSRQELERQLGIKPQLFAYPNGNFTGDLKGLVRKHGFMGAVTTRKGWVGKTCNLFEIPRIGIHQDISSTLPLFNARILCKWF